MLFEENFKEYLDDVDTEESKDIIDISAMQGIDWEAFMDFASAHKAADTMIMLRTLLAGRTDTGPVMIAA